MSVELFDAWGRGLGAWVVETTVWTVLVLGGVLLLDRGVRRWLSPGGRMVLFALVFVRLVLPGDFSSSLGLLPAVETGALVLPDVYAAATEAAAARGTVSAGSEVARTGLPWGVSVLGVYAVGVLLLGSAIGLAHLRLRRRVRAGGKPRELPGGLTVLEHETAGPLAVGGEIVIPRRLFAELDPVQLRAVVDHERAHLRHRDPWIATGLATACVLAWPVLPVWVAARRIRFLMELRADAAAVTGSGTAGYRRVMLRMAAMGWKTEALSPGFGPVAALEARLAALGSTGLGPVWLQLVATAGVGAIVLCCVGRGEPEAKTVAAVAEAKQIKQIEPRAEACPVPLMGMDLEPTEPELVEASARLRAKLRTAGSHGRSAEAVAREVSDEAAALGLRRVRAEARFVLGQALAQRGAFEEAEEELEEAAWLGASMKHDGIAVIAAGELVTLGLRTGRREDALAWYRHHVAAYKRIRAGAPLPNEARMLEALIAHFEAIGETREVPELRKRLAVVRAAGC
jgi:hypothetical protein